MAIRFQPLGPVIAAEVTGIDLREPLTPAQAQEIHDGMDRYAVLVFHEQNLTNEQHLAFTQALGPIEHAKDSSLRRPQDFRLPTTFADVSNLDREQNVFSREDRRRLFAIGNRLWHWLGRTPVVTFFLCPLAVIAFVLALHGGRLTIVPWGAPLTTRGASMAIIVRCSDAEAGGGAP